MTTLMKKIPTNKRFQCHTSPCIHDGIHEVALYGVVLGVYFCCPHFDDFMYELGLDQPDGEAGYALFVTEHKKTCGYVAVTR